MGKYCLFVFDILAIDLEIFFFSKSLFDGNYG